MDDLELERGVCKVALLTKDGKRGRIYAIEIAIGGHEFHMDMEGAFKISENIIKCIQHAKDDDERRSERLN